MFDYRNLDVWAVAHELTIGVYRHTSTFPVEERFGLVSQLRRAATSIGANLAEGSGHDSRNEVRRFARIAAGSAAEVQYLLEVARDTGMLEAGVADHLLRLAHRAKRMLRGLIRSL